MKRLHPSFPLCFLALLLVGPALSQGLPGSTTSKPVGADQTLASLRTRALAGEASGQFELGNAYYFGRGVPRDQVQSSRWYRKAADQGHPGAQLNLGNAFCRGEGLPRDPVEGYVWLILSAWNGHPAAAANRDQAARKLSPQAREQAQARAQLLQLRNPSKPPSGREPQP